MNHSSLATPRSPGLHVSPPWPSSAQVTVAELLCEALALAQAVDADAVEPGASLNVLAPQLAPRALRLGTGKEYFFLVWGAGWRMEDSNSDEDEDGRDQNLF